MSLTMGTGPLAGKPGGAFNFDFDRAPAHRILFEPFQPRLRARIGSTTILDTTGARLLHESNILPLAYVPLADLDPSLLERTRTTTHCPFKGDATYWSLRLSDDDVRPDLVWGYEQPMEGAEWLKGYAALYWDRVDEIYVEDERQLGRLRDPYHRVDAMESSRHVRVTADGEVVAETDRPVMVYETGLPPRAYLPRADVRAGVLSATATRTVCPYKGEATYWSVRGIEDAAWSYEIPLPEALPARGHVSFAGEGIEVEIA
jgi:uncharacterized protein (DUF427 family)